MGDCVFMIAERWRLGILVLVGLVMLLGIPAGLRAEEKSLLCTIDEEIAGILEQNRAGVVRIHTNRARSETGEGLQLGKGFTQGTGFLFDSRGYILTVEEAVLDAETITVTLASGLQVPAALVATDPASEVAVVRVSAEGLPSVVLGDSDRMRIGYSAIVLGNAFGQLMPSFGRVHELSADRDLIQVVMPVHPGYGGAPVFCGAGGVVGIVWAAPSPWPAVSQGRGGVAGWQELPTTVFVIPINRALQIARRLVDEHDLAYGWLGVEGEYDPEAKGVRVTGIAPDGPASDSGIRPGDLILSYQDRRIESAEHLQNLVMGTVPGTQIQIKIKRGAQPPMVPQVEVGRLAATARPVSLQALSIDASREDLFQRIDSLQRQIWQLQQQQQQLLKKE